MKMLSKTNSLCRYFAYNIINKRHKFYVLLPEVPSDTPENNPLLRPDTLPLFSELNTEKCINALGKLIIEFESGVHYLDQKLYDANIHRNVQNVILPLDQLSGPLDFGWGVFKVLYATRKDDILAESYLKMYPRVLKAKREKYFSSSIYSAFKELKENSKDLTAPVQRIVDKHLLESQFSGMDLTENRYKQFQSIVKKLDTHRTNYKRNLTRSSALFSHDLEFDDVKNLPRELLKLFAVDESNITKGPWRLTLNPVVYKTFMEYCDNRKLRWNTWIANNVRASSVSGNELNNSVEIEGIRQQRMDLAKLLGFATFADLSMRTKMAGSVENVKSMLTTLYVKSKAATSRQMEELEEFAKKNGFYEELEQWDIPYWQRLHKEEIFNIDDAVARQYFPLPVVLKGLFAFCQKLFGITVKEVKGVDVWHEDVAYYKIYDENDKEIASFYMDPYLREGKTLTSLMEIGKNRSDVTGSEPLSYLLFNFHPPALGKPSLLSYDDLKMLMKKFGHLLQHSLTTIPYAEVSGLTNLEWDVVNVCPLVMNSFLKHYGTISTLSCHVDSGKVIPPEVHETLIKRDEYMLGLKLTEEIYLSALDLEFYSKRDYWLNICKNVWPQYMPFPFEMNVAPACSFPEIFSDYYPAAYFCNLWSEMIAADVFSAFVEAGLDNDENIRQIGKRFRETYLSLGGGCHPGEVFRKFRGRDPCADAYLVSNGLMNKSNT